MAANRDYDVLAELIDRESEAAEMPPLDAYDDEPKARRKGLNGAAVAPMPTTFLRQPMRWPELQGKSPPERAWHIEHWLTEGLTLLSGNGGIGKTLLAQTIATALALKRNFVDCVNNEFKVLFWACEDSHDELWRRQVAICRYFDVNMADLEGKLIIEPRSGQENSLYLPIMGTPTWTPLRKELEAQMKDYGANALFLDNIGQTYGCSENDRHAVTAFLNGFAAISPVTLLLGHPAKAQGSEFSGSTAWENAVRMRWYLGTQLPDQKQDEEGEEEDPNVRYLAKRKTNYTVRDFRRLTYKEGVFVPDRAEEGSFTQRYGFAQRSTEAEQTILRAMNELKAIGMYGRAAHTSPDFLPKKIIQMKLGCDCTERELRDALNRLLLKKQVHEIEVGRLANRQPRMGIVRT